MILWSGKELYSEEPFELESDLEKAVVEVAPVLFGPSRIYIDTKRRIGAKGKKQNIPDGYLIDLTSKKEPRLYVVENELARHEPLKHIAVQILEFSLAFETAKMRVKQVVKEALSQDGDGLESCIKYARKNGFENIDVLLERMIYPLKAFNALVIIDEMPDDLENVLMSRFNFPVEIITLQRFCSPDGDCLYQFEPFLQDVIDPARDDEKIRTGIDHTLDPSEIDTIVVPARDEGFEETFIGENCWYKIRIHSSMKPKIEWIAAYRVAPISAITHIAPVKSIEQFEDTNKYILIFSEPAQKIDPVKLVNKGTVKAPQAPRYTSMERLQNAKTLDEAF